MQSMKAGLSPTKFGSAASHAKDMRVWMALIELLEIVAVVYICWPKIACGERYRAHYLVSALHVPSRQFVHLVDYIWPQLLEG